VSGGGWAQAGRTAILTVVILLVVVIGGGLLIEAVVQHGAKSTTSRHVFAGPTGFTADLASGKVTSVSADTQSQIIVVRLSVGSDYTVAYPHQTRLDRLLLKHPTVHYSVDGKARQ
jgi:hypothetical protein